MTLPETTVDNNKKKLDFQQVKVLSLIEQLFWETGFLPDNSIVADKLKMAPQFIEKCYKHPVFREALVVRGIDLTPESTNKVLQPKQVMLANLLLNAFDKRSVREKLEQVQVSTQQYNAWLRQPAFSGYLRKRAEEVFKASDHEAYQGVLKSVQSGDVNALKFFFELRGIYSPRIQLDVNIESVIVQVVEVVQRHVKDPSILTAIANEIEGIVNPRRESRELNAASADATATVIEAEAIEAEANVSGRNQAPDGSISSGSEVSFSEGSESPWTDNETGI